MNGYAIGRLKKGVAGEMLFSYADSWLAQEGARPISLSMPLQQSPYRGDVVYNYFDNLLPDSRPIRDRVQARFRVSSSHPFDLLEAIGMDCVGAIQLVPEGSSPPDVHTISGMPLAERDIADMLNDYRRRPLGMGGGENAFRLSIAGAQEKTALLRHDGGWMEPRGATPTTHILKLPIGRIEHSGIDLADSCENEWLCLEIVRAFGLPACRASISVFDDTKTLVVERFDRLRLDGWIARLPQEDVCQALGLSPNLKYESDGGPGMRDVMDLLWRSERARADRRQFFKSQVLFWLLAAVDGHAKNFSLFIRPYGRFHLTPLYDVMSAYPLLENGNLSRRDARMAMAFRGRHAHYRWHEILPRHVVAAGQRAGLSNREAVECLSELVNQAGEALSFVESSLPDDFPDTVAGPIFAGIRRQGERAARYLASA
ncbi:type II toxin-antitoxin system HipA family toxin [Guyparkeria sp.]|uniref:type II toxin-antitoxin system HipA family toxin n=1 Tax=Guyparkeria sp. TaxID=2035736 RepID=UPI0039708C12